MVSGGACRGNNKRLVGLRSPLWLAEGQLDGWITLPLGAKEGSPPSHAHKRWLSRREIDLQASITARARSGRSLLTPGIARKKEPAVSFVASRPQRPCSGGA
jgi:hypothetical protein